MTNEEKAKELSREWAVSGTEYTAYDCLMQMAEWKDEYYKELLDLLVKSGANIDIITNYIENCIEL